MDCVTLYGHLDGTVLAVHKKVLAHRIIYCDHISWMINQCIEYKVISIPIKGTVGVCVCVCVCACTHTWVHV